MEEIKLAVGSAPFVWLETALPKNPQHPSFLFTHPINQVEFFHGDSVDPFFKKLEAFLNAGYWLAGYFTYEFGYYLDTVLYELQDHTWDEPLAWFGVFHHPMCFNKNELTHFKIANSKNDSSKLSTNSGFEFLCNSITKSDYDTAIQIIRRNIESGNTYQVNYTFKQYYRYTDSPIALYNQLKNNQPTSYLAYLQTPFNHILSCSPECFFQIQDSVLQTKPMKGTVKRGLWYEQDQHYKTWLLNDEKNRAENAMIVDLMRNDMTPLSEPGTVNPVHLFQVESYTRLHQLTSTIQSRIKSPFHLHELFSRLFPCGSITGAPKLATMKIIRELETKARGIYTGSIGYFSPQRNACFNVAIRTLQMKNGHAELGIGGGITYDSLDTHEFEEATLKSKFVQHTTPNFALLETMRWESGKGIFLVEEHIQRLEHSFSYFQCSGTIESIKQTLRMYEPQSDLANTQIVKIRLLVYPDSHYLFQEFPYNSPDQPVSIAIHPTRMNAANTWLYHKTTHRSFYDTLHAEARKQGFYDWIFLNQEGYLTEGCISTLFLVSQGRMVTPSLACGLLPGTLRQHLLNTKQVTETYLCEKDLLQADEVYVGNSVSGLLRATLVDESQNRIPSVL